MFFNFLSNFCFSSLAQNLRIGRNHALAAFDQYLQDLGDGQVPVQEEPDWIALPSDNVFEIDDTNPSTVDVSMEEFCDKIFPDLEEKFYSSEAEWIQYLGHRAILAPRHVDVNIINEKVNIFHEYFIDVEVQTHIFSLEIYSVGILYSKSLS